ncbi:MAG TPA: hypothetical protein VGW10_16435, partial [Solirubrobacteraceae bacterium]|nr:hypothetical protein [Solirubrobacteraceae bacterium]
VGDAEGLLCLLTDRIDATLLETAPRLRVISNFAVGADNVDVEEATRRGFIRLGRRARAYAALGRGLSLGSSSNTSGRP